MQSDDTLTRVRLRNIKRAKLKQLEATLTLQINDEESDETIQQTIQDIEKTKMEIKKLA
ncbi:MAG: hypothetical protein UHM08_08930 [Bacteroidales bacterium]|nr:hypothetical protein [Bacteroidales bacterium]